MLNTNTRSQVCWYHIIERGIMSTRKMYMFYFLVGSANAIAIQMLPLALTDKGFTSSQITLVLSVVFFAALFQPIVGYFTRTRLGSKGMINLLLLSMIITAGLMLVNQIYALMLVIILIFSIGRTSITPIFDSYSTMASIKHNVNYGLVRSGASLGFGTGMIIYAATAKVFNLSDSSSFLIIAILLGIGAIVLSFLPHEQQQSHEQNDQESKTNVKVSILLILMFMLYFGGLNLRISYLSMYYIEFGYSTSFISITTFFMVLPEVLFLPLYNRLFAHFNKSKLLAIAIGLGIIQMLMYISFTASPGLLIFCSLFNGFQIMVFFPTFFGLLQKSLGPKNSSFGFLMNMTIMSLFVGVFNTLVIRPLYLGQETTLIIFWVIIGLQIASFVPLAIYFFKYSKQ